MRAVPGCQGAELWDGQHRTLWKSPLEALVAASVQGGDRLQARRGDPVIERGAETVCQARG